MKVFYLESFLAYFSIIIIFTALSFAAGRLIWVQCLLLAIFVCIFSARLGIGHDYFQYKTIYQEISNGGFSGVNEPGFKILIEFISAIFGKLGFYIFLWIFQFLCYLMIAFIIHKYSGRFWLFYIVLFLSGFIFFANNVVRQSLSIAIYVYSLYFYKGPVRFLLLNTFAAVFVHISSIFPIIFTFLASMFVFRRSFYVVLVAASFILFKLNFIAGLTLSLAKYVPIYGAIYSERVAQAQLDYQGGGAVIYFYYLCLLVMAYFYYRKPKENVWHLSVVGMSVYLLAPHLEMWERLFYPFLYLFLITFLITVIVEYRRKWSRFYVAAMFVPVFVGLVGYQILTNANKNKISPLEFVGVEFD